MKYHLVILGCQMNRSDAERVRTVIDGLGYTWTDNEVEADLLGVVACSVRQKAIDRAYTRIHRWNEWKQSRSLLTFVSGCILPADRKKFLKRFDFVFTMNELPQFPDMLRQYGMVTPLAVRHTDAAGRDASSLAGRSLENADQTARVEPRPPVSPHRASGGQGATPAAAALITLASLARPRSAATRPVMTGLWQVPASPTSAFEAFVPIQNGCDKFCTFCAVPYTRGREVSRPSADILREVSRLLEQGYQSITLLGQNVNSYGRDKPGEEMTFAALLDAIGTRAAQAGRRVWIYFTSPHPRDMTPDVIEAVARHPALARQIHLPLQSGDDKVLLRMNRQHSVAQYRAIVDLVRAKLPEATLFTDIIVGFSGETAAQFDNTCRVLADIGFNMVYATLYSPRPGAASSRWKDDIPLDEKRRRLQVLNEIVKQGARAANVRLVGRTLPVLITGRDDKHAALQGLTEGKINVRVAADEPAWIGRFVDTTFTDVTIMSLSGEPVAAAVSA